MTRGQRKLDNIILTLAAYPHMRSQIRRDITLDGLLLQIEQYLLLPNYPRILFGEGIWAV